MPTSTNVPLLSFIYKVFTDPEFQLKFQEDPEAAMDEFELTWAQKVAIYHSGADPVFVTREPVSGYPLLMDAQKVATSTQATVGPNPVTGDWWGAYAQFKAAKMSGKAAPPVPNPQVNERPLGDPASLAGVMTLLSEELSQASNWKPVW